MALYTMMSLCVLCSEEHLEMQAAKEMELRREVERKLATENSEFSMLIIDLILS